MFQKQNLRKNNLGKSAEDYASALLRSGGYKIIGRNFRSRFGEIDIVAIDGDTLVFCEVKARIGRKFGLPEEAVTPKKLYKIQKTAEYFSMQHPDLPKRLRIDVVAIEIKDSEIVSSRIIPVV